MASFVRFLVLTVFYLFYHGCESLYFPQGCIPEDQYIFCTSVNALNGVSILSNITSQLYLQIIALPLNGSLLSQQNTYNTAWIDVSSYNNIIFDSLSTCFYSSYDHIEYNIYDTQSTLIAYYSSQSIDYPNSTDILNSPSSNIHNLTLISSATHAPTIELTTWLSNAQCIEITKSTMYFANNYFIIANMCRITHANESSIFQSSELSNLSVNPNFNSIFCLPGYPQSFLDNNDNGLIASNFTLYDATTDTDYYMQSIYESPSLPCCYDSSAPTANTTTTLHFTMGNVELNYHHSCLLCRNCTDAMNDDNDSFNKLYKEISEDSMYYTCILIAILLFMLSLCCCGVCYTKKAYKSSDPVYYSNLLWCLLDIWDFSSHCVFTVYLIYQFLKLTPANTGTNETDHVLLFVLIVLISTTILTSYLCNLLYLIHYLQIWNHSEAPGCTRHWLELWSWMLILITMTMGAVNVSLEICNSIIIPTDVFAMHLSHSELVRTRKDRFITKVVMQDIPMLCIISCYVAYFHNSNNDNVHIPAMQFIVVWNVLLVTIISIISTSLFRFIRRNYSHDNPLAQYQFSFTLKTPEWRSHWIHSHRRIQRCLRFALFLRKDSLTVIDQCSESLNAMKVEGRILRDNKWKSERVEKMASKNVTKEEMRTIGLDLLQKFKKEFGLQYKNDIVIDHLVIRPIMDGQLVYDHSTCVQILCIGVKRGCHGFCHALCPDVVAPVTKRTSRAYTVDSIVKHDHTIVSDSEDANVEIRKKSSNLQSELSGKKKLSVNQTSNLPMITISSQLENLADTLDDKYDNSVFQKHIQQKSSYDFTGYITKDHEPSNEYISPKTTETFDFDNQASAPATPQLNPQQLFADAFNNKKRIKKKSTDYGYESKRAIVFADPSDKVEALVGKAPVAFSTHDDAPVINQNDDIYDEESISVEI